MKLKVFLSSCGTSILTNTKDESVRKTIIKASNYRLASDASSEDLIIINNRIKQAEKELLATQPEQARSASAELAGILAYYDGDLSKGKQDTHYLLSTDTWLGEVTANLTRLWLEKNKLRAQVHKHADLQTADWGSFSSSLSDLVKWCHDTFEPQKESSEILFNLSGGFKAETGFLQILGIFYADETFYIFERSKQLMVIPKLPVKMDDREGIINDLSDIRRADCELTVRNKKDSIYWCAIDDEYTLTPWGELVFKNMQKEIFQTKLFDSISDQIVLEKSFIENCNKHGSDRFYEINTRIDQLALMQEHPNSPNPKSLDFKRIQGPKHLGCDFECDAWHDGKAFRIYATKKGDTVFIKHLGEALH